MSKKILRVIKYFEQSQIKRGKVIRAFRSRQVDSIEQQYEKNESEIEKFIDEQLNEYGFAKNPTKQELRQQQLKSKINIKKTKDRTIQLSKHLLKLEKELSFLELEQLSYMITSMSRKEKNSNRNLLKMTSKKIQFQMQNNSKMAKHVLEAAEKVVNQIHQILSSKSNLIA